MNLFVFDTDPVKAAMDHPDKYLVKMPVETAQLLCTAQHILPKVKTNAEYTIPYKKTHENHPCAKWIRVSKQNYIWAVNYGLALCDLYTKVYKKDHASKKVIEWAIDKIDFVLFPFEDITEFKQAMPECYRQVNDAPAAYQDYFRKEKWHLAKWTLGAPSWWF